MKQLIIATLATAAFAAFAQEVEQPVVVVEQQPVYVAEPEPVVVEQPVVVAEPEPVVVEQPVYVAEPEPVVVEQPVVVVEQPVVMSEEDARDAAAEEECDCPFCGFGSYGFYSGYQLYGSLINPEPTLQGYAELNANLSIDETSLGYLGVGVWSNTDLTDRRRNSYGKAFNEWDFNIHWGYTLWLDDEQTVGLAYRTSVVWYYYPHRRHDHMWGSTATTVDWNHYVELVNPFVIPFANFVHEYHESDGNLIEFGVKKPITCCERLSVTPSATFVWRNSHYNWCFPTAGFTEFHNQGVATAKLMLEANYKINDNFGLFAKVAYCHIVDPDLRDAAEHSSGADYGKYKDFAWGGVGVCFNF